MENQQRTEVCKPKILNYFGNVNKICYKHDLKLRNQILHEFLVILKPLTGVYKEKSSACNVKALL